VPRIGWVWRITKDLGSIDPDEREQLWERIETYLDMAGLGGFVPDVRELSDRIRRLQDRDDFAALRNLGDPRNIAKFWINDWRTKEDARYDNHSTEWVVRRLETARRYYAMIRNLKLDVRTSDSRRRNYWRRLRAEISRDIIYWDAVLEWRHLRYEQVRRRMKKGRSRRG